MKLFIRIRQSAVLRHVGRGLATLVALLAAAVVVSLTMDLGPHVRRIAEERASDYLERPVHIGRLSIHVFTGKYVVDDLRIDGVRPADRPFFTAKRLAVAMDWGPAFAARPDIVITSVEMTDWRMLVEKWDGGHNFPKVRHDDDKSPSKGPKRVTTTLRWFRASRGEFIFEDHETPWGIVCRNLDIDIGNLPAYHGTATFTGGTVSIQDFVPMWANFKAQFVLDGPRIQLDRIDIDTDGAKTVARGSVDVSRWPEQSYQVKSRVNFPRMRRLFFKDADWDLTGDGDFTGTFRLFKGGHDLSGTFTSPLAGVNEYRFPDLYGSLRWTPASFDVWNAGSGFYGGDAAFSYSIKPLGSKTRPTHRFDSTLTGVDLARFTDFQRWAGVRFAGSASLHNVLEWPGGRFSEHRGDGHLVVVPPPGVTLMTSSLAAVLADPARADAEWGPFAPPPLPAHLPIGGEVSYRYGPADVTFEGGRFITERSHVTFEGATAWGDRSRIPFHVTSRDWQESDQLLAGIISDFGAPTGPVPFGGFGEFDGVMLGPFRDPRVEGTFTGHDLRAWDTIWGDGTAKIAFEHHYINVTGGVVRLGRSEIDADGLFSTGYPRDDGGEQIDARFKVVDRDLAALRHAFEIDDYPVSGRMSGDFHLTGEYERPVGFGGMTIDDGTAYGEPFEKAKASLRFDGSGVRLDNAVIAKSTGSVTGAAFIGWNSTYAFNADGRRIPVDRLAFLAYPQVPLSGLAEFTADGNGTFDSPRYDVHYRVTDLHIADETIGQLSGTLGMRGDELVGGIDAASPRLTITGTGRISRTTNADADISFRFLDSSLDPYVRLFVPKLSPYTTAVASGSVRIVGPLADFHHLSVDGTVDTVDMRLLDYAVHNAAPIRLTLDQEQVRIGELELIGDDTRLKVQGTVGLRDQRIAVTASGDANLGILQGFMRDVRSSGRAELAAAVDGPLAQPLFSGRATISDGRLRHFSLPNALDAINGTIRFDAGGLRLDDVTATLGGGRVQFGGRIGFDGFVPDELNVTVRGEDMHLRYPEDIRSIVDADLAVQGSFKAPVLRGLVTVKNASWNRRVNVPSIYDLAARRGSADTGAVGGEAAAPAVPLRFDVQILVPSTLRIDNNLARIVASADLSLRGTYDRPSLLGHADVERGEVTFETHRYKITRGTIDFTNPARIEPFFDVEAETIIRVPQQTYRVTVAAAGTTEQLRPTLSSDPPLPQADVLSLLFGGGQRSKDVELRALANPNERQADILAAQGGQYLFPSQRVGNVVEQTFGVDTFQLTPSFIDPYGQQTARLNPTARLTIGKRISDRVYLTFSRSLGSIANDQIVLLEYEATDRLSWILSRNEDQQTYALEFRVRHVF